MKLEDLGLDSITRPENLRLDLNVPSDNQELSPSIENDNENEALTEKKNVSFEKEQKHSPRVTLFFSFDIVNSTMYKGVTRNWPIVIKQLLDTVLDYVYSDSGVNDSLLWRVIGDEMVFVLTLYDENEMIEAVDSVFKVLTNLNNYLKTGDFFDKIEGQNIEKSEIEYLKTHNLLALKGAAWIAVVNRVAENAYDCVETRYMATSHNQEFKEFLGSDIDTGFRIKEFTQKGRLIISFELAHYLIKNNQQNSIYIMDYKVMKGVWNKQHYPIIWYHNGSTANGDFDNSFEYDETQWSELSKNYLNRRMRNVTDAGAIETSDEFNYDVRKAITSIVSDRAMKGKIDYFDAVLSSLKIPQINALTYSLEVHCAVVCCDIKERKVMIVHRTDNHKTNPSKWEFGCAKLTSEENITECVTNYYLDKYGVKIDLVRDRSRGEQQPMPIALYEITGEAYIKKGIILVASAEQTNSYREDREHDDVKWISKDEVGRYATDAVRDFENTINTVFVRFDEFFGEQ
ncbi:MAG: hypothetical protein IJK17_06425 [Lachnospiraceae bacterium]|nr:hypothetical protein [Lachnospiraceae bacterium]